MAHWSSPWTVSTAPWEMMPATLELPFSLPCPQLVCFSSTFYLVTCCQIKLPEAVYLKTMRGPGTHKMKPKSPRGAFPTSLHLAQIFLQSHLMPLATVPTEAAFPERTATLGASLITRFPHTWNVLSKHLHLFKLHPKTYSNHLVRKRSRSLTVGHKLPL